MPFNYQGRLDYQPINPQIIEGASKSPFSIAGEAMTNLDNAIEDRRFKESMLGVKSSEDLLNINARTPEQMQLLSNKQNIFNALSDRDFREQQFKRGALEFDVGHGLDVLKFGEGKRQFDVGRQDKFDIQDDEQNFLMHKFEQENKAKIEAASKLAESQSALEKTKLENKIVMETVKDKLSKANAINPAQAVINNDMAQKAIDLSNMSNDNLINYFDTADIDINENQATELKVLLRDIMRVNPEGFKIGGYEPKQLFETLAASKDHKLDPNTYTDWLGNTTFDMVHKSVDTKGKPLHKQITSAIKPAVDVAKSTAKWASPHIQKGFEEVMSSTAFSSQEERADALRELLKYKVTRK